jgi:hypothetical protein
MIRLRPLLQSVNVLNVLLATAVAAVAYFSVIPVPDPAVRISLPHVKQAVALTGGAAAPSENISPIDYALISNQNLFHPTRMIPPEKPSETVLPRPDLFLYGTLIANGTSYAFIEDKKAPYSTAGRGKRQVILKKGDSVSGYILSEIEANRIVLVKGEEKLTVMLDDKGKKRSDETSPLPASAAKIASGSVVPSPPLSLPPQTAPSALPAAAPSATAPGTPGMASPSSAPAVTPSFKPGIGASGSWPPTKSTIEQTQQKIREGQLMRTNQLHPNQ